MLVFKVLKISPDQFEVICNLRDLPSKQLNLNYSNNDVQFNPRDGEYNENLSLSGLRMPLLS